jgi:rhomboid protease GluP
MEELGGSTEPALHPAVEYMERLRRLTPYCIVTPVIVGINVVVFGLMVATGVSAVSPTVPDLLQWGANYGPLTTGGMWWRLLSAVFLHIGIIHLCLNMWCLITAGPLVERLVGNVGFALLYLVAGCFGSIASFVWNPQVVSAGASGAIFGVYGALLAIYLRSGHTIPLPVLRSQRSSATAFVLYNLLFGLLLPQVDNAAHIGGLVAGFLCGLLLAQPVDTTALRGRPIRNLVLTILGTLLIVMAITCFHGSIPDTKRELAEFSRQESVVLAAYRDAQHQFARQQITPEEMTRRLETEIIPPWNAEYERLKRLQNAAGARPELLAQLLEYAELRLQSWQLLAEGLRSEDPALLRQSQEKMAESSRIVEQLQQPPEDRDP